MQQNCGKHQNLAVYANPMKRGHFKTLHNTITFNFENKFRGERSILGLVGNHQGFRNGVSTDRDYCV